MIEKSPEYRAAMKASKAMAQTLGTKWVPCPEMIYRWFPCVRQGPVQIIYYYTGTPPMYHATYNGTIGHVFAHQNMHEALKALIEHSRREATQWLGVMEALVKLQ